MDYNTFKIEETPKLSNAIYSLQNFGPRSLHQGMEKSS